MPNLPGSFIWYELMSPDPAASKAFYDAVVGWDINTQSTGPEGTDYRMIKRSDGGNAGGVLKLDDAMREHGARPMWLGYLSVNDVDAAVAEVATAGGTALMPPFDAPSVGRIAMITDPQGAPFYVMKPTPPSGAEGQSSDVFSVDQPQHVRWNELTTSDPDAAITFYTGQFGWAQEGDMDMGEMGQYRFLQQAGVAIGAVMPRQPQSPANAWTYYIGVDDIDRAAKAIVDGGGQILSGPMEIPGGEFAVAAIDPQQAPFGLVGPRK